MKHVLFYLFLSLICTNCTSQPFERDIITVINRYKIPGISLAYIKEGKLVENISTGRRDDSKPVTKETVFSAASLSKPVFAYAVMQLVSVGKLELDTPLYRYYSWPDIEYDKRNKLITARMILSHTSGLPNWRRKGDTLRFQYEPGKQFRYSGEGFVYLSKVVEQIAGKPIEEFMQETIFRPLGMARSSYIWQKPFEPDFALPHNSEGETQDNFFPSKANVAASLQTTAGDYAKFLIALMNGQNLSVKVFQQMLEPQPNAKMQKKGDELYWALGIAYQKTNTGIGYWQWGDNGDWKAFVMVYPEHKDALVYFTNSTYGLDAAPKVLKLFFKGPQPSLNWLKSN